MSQKNNTNSEQCESIKYKELDLLDIVFLLWQGKWIIITLIIITVGAAGVYLKTSKDKWKSTAVLTQPEAAQMAYYSIILNNIYAPNKSVNNTQNLPDPLSPNILQQSLFNRFSASLAAPSSVNVSISQLDKTLNYPLSISLTADSASHAQAQLSHYIQQVGDAIVNDYVAEIDTSIREKTRELTASLAAQKDIAGQRNEHRLAVIRYALKIAEASNVSSSQLHQAENLSDETLYLLGTDALKAMIANESEKPPVLDKQYFDTQAQLLAISQLKPDAKNLQPFTYITEPDLPSSPVTLRKSLILLVAAIFGALAGSAIVMVRNMVGTYRLRQKS